MLQKTLHSEATFFFFRVLLFVFIPASLDDYFCKFYFVGELLVELSLLLVLLPVHSEHFFERNSAKFEVKVIRIFISYFSVTRRALKSRF